MTIDETPAAVVIQQYGGDLAGAVPGDGGVVSSRAQRESWDPWNLLCLWANLWRHLYCRIDVLQ
jgi:hypothetical protein